MSVEHGGTHVRMPQQFLHRTNVVPSFEQMSRETMPKGVAARRLQDTRIANGALGSPLSGLFMLMRARKLSRVRILAKGVPWKDPLPAPLNRAIRILAGKPRRQPVARLAYAGV